MSNYIDVEGMRSAASRMCSAAEGMKTAAGWMGEYVLTYKRTVEEQTEERQRALDREVQLLACRTELEMMIAHDAGLEGQAGRYAESAYDDLRKRIAAL